ncbi:S-methyl-5'-thioinosine phosphorylase [Knoellia sp. CPCC 206435]|uniref:S-methyl-5'-thioinosine phosphorylase n=1 Tax=Knoellia terrae TaxID=3404797 RepID=UPI003B42F5F3
MSRQPLGVVAGTGFASIDALDEVVHERVRTAYGEVALTRGTWHGLPVVFVPRHGVGHVVPPHRIDHRALIRALADLEVRDVVAVNVTGGIDPDLEPGDLVCVDDFLDLTRGRETTFFENEGAGGVVHTDMTHAYHPVLRRELLDAAGAAGETVVDGGVYACFDGPRFESPAEIRLAALAGGTVVGMTGVPEVTLAVEAGLRYAAISLVVNPAAGVRPEEPITMEEIEAVMGTGVPRVLAVLDELVHTRAVLAVEDDA